MAEAGYDPKRSKVSDSTMTDFIRGEITGDITEVPGVGPAAATKLAKEDDTEVTVETTYQLIGHFLSLKGKDVKCAEHCQRMWYFLQDKGITAHRSAIVKAIAEKTNTMIPGIYDETALDDKEEDADDDSDEEEE